MHVVVLLGVPVRMQWACLLHSAHCEKYIYVCGIWNRACRWISVADWPHGICYWYDAAKRCD